MSLLTFWDLSYAAEEDLPPMRVALVLSAKGDSEAFNTRGISRPLKVGSVIYLGDKVKTSRNATINIIFIDQSEVSLAGNTDLTIDDYAFGGMAKPRSKLSVKNGAFRFLAGKIAKMAPENYTIETETATIGIRGSGGSVRTADGRNGETAFLEIATIEGHVLDIQTISSEKYIVDDPKKGLRVHANGSASFYDVKIPPYESAIAGDNLAFNVDERPLPSPYQPYYPAEEAIRVNLFLSRHRIVRLKQRSFKLLGKEGSLGLELLPQCNKVRPTVEARDIELSAESTSSKRKLPFAPDKTDSKKMFTRTIPALGLREVTQVDVRESGSAHHFLKQMGEKQRDQAEDKELSYTVPAHNPNKSKKDL